MCILSYKVVDIMFSKLIFLQVLEPCFVCRRKKYMAVRKEGPLYLIKQATDMTCQNVVNIMNCDTTPIMATTPAMAPPPIKDM